MRAALLSLPLLLAACLLETPAPPVAAPGPNPDACGALGLQGLIGQPASALQTMKFAGPVRVIRPGMAVTMDYLENRLNISVNKAGTIDRVTCG